MTEKEKAEMMNLRRRVEAQREEIKVLRRTIAELKARIRIATGANALAMTDREKGAADGQTGV